MVVLIIKTYGIIVSKFELYKLFDEGVEAEKGKIRTSRTAFNGIPEKVFDF